MKQLVVIEDETLMCDLLAQVLAKFPLCVLAGVANDGLAGWAMVQKLKPDMVMLDIKLPTLNGLEILRHIRRHLPSCRVLIFSGHLNPPIVRQALQAGAHGIIEKTARLSEMEKAVRVVLDGGAYLGPTVSQLVRTMMIDPPGDDSFGLLSERERQVLQLIAEAYTNKEIAAKLSVSTKTVESHRAHLMTKLDLHNVASLTRYAIDHDLVNATPV